MLLSHVFIPFIKVALVIKECMEGAINLCVPLEVKMKVGQSWGSLEDYHVSSSQVLLGGSSDILDMRNHVILVSALFDTPKVIIKCRITASVIITVTVFLVYLAIRPSLSMTGFHTISDS